MSFNHFNRLGLPPELRQPARPPVWVLPQKPTAGELRGASRLTEDESNSPLPKVEVRQSPGRGLGLFAVEPIPAYTRIVEDYALISLAKGDDLPQIYEKYQLLPPDLKQEFDALDNAMTQQKDRVKDLETKLRRRGYAENKVKQMVQVAMRFQTNSFSTAISPGTSPSQKWIHGLFTTVARMNHSCTPNAHSHYRPSSGAELVYSLRDIDAGEEIEISYLTITMPRAERQRKAQNWAFVCTCPACSGCVAGGSKKYEELLAHVHQEGAFAVPRDPRPFRQESDRLRKAIDLANSSDYPWLLPALPGLYQRLSTMFLFGPMGSHQDRKTSRQEVTQALERVIECETKMTGAGSPSSIDVRRALDAHISGEMPPLSELPTSGGP